jgi:MFS family permease
MHQPANPAEHDPYSAMRLASFRLYLAGNAVAILGMQMQRMAVGWEIYERTGSELDLGWVGLVQVLPVIFLALPAGHASDRHDRKTIVMISLVAMAAASLVLAWLSWTHGPLWGMYAALLVTGIARAFQQPAKASLLPQIVPREQFSNAVTWNMGAFQLAAVVGPALGGPLIAHYGQPVLVYLCDVIASMLFCGLLVFVRRAAPTSAPASGVSLASLTAGVRFLQHNKILLAAMTLDMFAVLLGGAVTLLPVFAEKILHVGATGFGWLGAAPAVGALCTSMWLAHRPPIQHAGRDLLLAVAGFGVVTIGFGLSHSFAFSLIMLLLTGALDMISVVIRHTLVQLLTPDSMRGRVSAVNSMFIGASNELGGFESGLVAYWAGSVFSVVSGGIGTLVVVALVTWQFAPLRRYGRLDGTVLEDPAQE